MAKLLDPRSSSEFLRVPRSASECLRVPRSASEGLGVPRSASEFLGVPRSFLVILFELFEYLGRLRTRASRVLFSL